MIPLLLTSCLTREKIEATIWFNNFPIPESICLKHPELLLYGHARKLNDGRFEVMSICKQGSHDFVSMPKDDFNKFLDENLPKPEKP